MRPASTSKKSPQSERSQAEGLFKSPPMWLCLTSCCRTRGRARPVSIREYRSLDLSTHIFAITSPPGGVHIFACPAAFATLRPNLAYFRLLPPYERPAALRPSSSRRRPSRVRDRENHSAELGVRAKINRCEKENRLLFAHSDSRQAQVRGSK